MKCTSIYTNMFKDNLIINSIIQDSACAHLTIGYLQFTMNLKRGVVLN